MDIIFLVGLPGSGKSTWRKEFCRRNPSYVVISSDDLLEKWARERGQSYREVWLSSVKETAKYNFADLTKALAEKRDIIIDRTNLVPRGSEPDPLPPAAPRIRLERQNILDLVPDGYRRIALVFEAPAEVIEARRQKRILDGEKTVPAEVIDIMRASYVPPQKGEFDIISTPDDFGARPQPGIQRARKGEPKI